MEHEFHNDDNWLDQIQIVPTRNKMFTCYSFVYLSGTLLENTHKLFKICEYPNTRR